MKKVVQLLILVFMSGGVLGQTFPYLKFRKPTTSDNINFKFNSVYPGTDAIVSIINSKNASVDRIDDSSSYAYAWNPWIKIASNAKSTDSSYVEFKITFVKAGTSTKTTMSKVAMTIVDLDGNGLGSYREMVKTSLPATPVGILGSSLSTLTSLVDLTLLSGIISFSKTDTSNFLAMSQVNYNNISSYTLKVGVLGNVSRNTVRQFSFYYKGFSGMAFVLPVKMMDLKVVSNNEVPQVQWKTTSEENCNRFEIYRSLDGVNFTFAGTVDAKGNSQTVSAYSFTDHDLFAQMQTNVFYKIRIVDNNETHTWSSIVHYGKAMNSTQNIISSVYPNPSKGILNISFSAISETEFTIEVVDVFGKTYRTINSNDMFGSNQLSLDLNDLSNGVYFVKLSESNGTSSSIKFLKN